MLQIPKKYIKFEIPESQKFLIVEKWAKLLTIKKRGLTVWYPFISQLLMRDNAACFLNSLSRSSLIDLNMKTYLLKILVRCSLASLLVVVFTSLSFGATNTWKGTTSSDWNTAGNWSSGIPKGTDDVQIGLAAYPAANQPTLSASGVCKTITFGNIQAVTLTINSPLTLAVSGAMTVNSGATVSIPGTGTLTIGGAYNNSGAITFGPGPLTITGTFTNAAGSTIFGTGLVTFNAPGPSNTQMMMTPNSILTFVNVLFTNGHFLMKTGGGSSAGYAIAPTGIFTLSNGANVNFPNTQGLTLYSDATGSATIAAIPAGCTLTAPAKVFVQRFIQGSSDLTKRGYRLLSSTVYTANDGISNVSDLQYLTNKVYVSGPGYAANGFNVTSTANPSIYLFREDDPPPPTSGTIFT
ncbi:MAG: hypothetical protein JWQ66_475, partial [Mucilaginibacter sp.]|nr:hypothetical protein [Mucilaginibacter sp.]